MRFVKLSQVRPSPQKDVHAVFSVPKKGTGNLRFTVSGINKVRELEIPLTSEDRVEVFFDKATGQVAIQRAQDGEFKLSRSSTRNDTLRITSQALTMNLKNPTRFRVEASGKFDVVLLPFPNKAFQR